MRECFVLLRCGIGWRKGLTCVVLFALFATGAGADERKLPFHIPRQPLARAIVEFALQARLSVSDTGIDFRDAVSSPVDGDYGPREALTLLLEGTGYGFDFLDTGSVRIRSIVAKPQSAPPAPGIETVVVTAMKREDVAQNLPYSISVTTGRHLENFGIQTSRALQAQVAGYTATNLGPGQDKVFVRGLTDSVLPGLSESMVGIYLDETRVAQDAPDPDLNLIDIDRVEIVRGPQGTLYGAGSLGGLVRIITRKPDLDTYSAMAAGIVSSTKNGGASLEWDGMVNVPLVRDVLGLRLVAYTQKDSGYIDDVRLKLSNVNHSRTQGGRLTLSWQPQDRWLVTASAVFQETGAADSQYYDAGLAPLVRDNYLQEPHSDRFAHLALTVEGSLGWADLVSTSAVVDRHLKSRYDATLAWPQLTGFALGPSPFDEGRSIVSFTHETRLASTGDGNWKWLAGVFVSHRTEDFQSRLSGPDALGAMFTARTETRDDRANEVALFGELTYDITDELAMTAGARVFDASRNVSAHARGIISGGDFDFKGSNSQKGVTPKFVLSYRPDDRAMIYAQVSEGYRLGGFNIDGPAGVLNDGGADAGEAIFDSDVLWNYELGTKTSFFNGRLVANAAVYFVAWNNVQTDQIGPDGSPFIVNAGNVHDTGFEIDLTAEPIEHLTLHANVFRNHARLSHPNPLLVQSEGLLPGAPDISFGASARYDIPLEDGFDAFASADYSYIGRSHLGFDENTAQMGGYHLTNLRFGVGHDGWEGVLFVNNLFDEEENTFAFGNSFSLPFNRQITPLRPRTIGFELTLSR